MISGDDATHAGGHRDRVLVRSQRAESMTASPIFELRLLTPSGERLRVGPIATHAAATALARGYLGDGRALRVEVFVRQRSRWNLISVLGRPKRPPARSPTEVDDDALDHEAAE
jgi:hypothetical protein